MSKIFSGSMGKMGVARNIATVKPSRVLKRGIQPDQMEKLQVLSADFLRGYGLTLKDVIRESLQPVPKNPASDSGFIIEELTIPFGLMHGVGALAVKADAFALGKNDKIKMRVDRAASGPQAVGLNEMLTALKLNGGPGILFEVMASEGERVKAGELGGNPARARGHIFGPWELVQKINDIKLGVIPEVSVFSLITDDVDGTGKAADGLHSSVTATVYTQSGAKALPDHYMDKIVSGRALPEFIDTTKSPREITAAFCEAFGIRADQLNLMNLAKTKSRQRHEKIIQEYLKMGVNFYRDEDGDVMPALASALGIFLLENGLPLHGIAANVGGAAEAGLLLPVLWRGGSVALQFASKSALKSGVWERKQDFNKDELATIQEYGFDPYSPFKLESIFTAPFADGISVEGGISDCLWMDPNAKANEGLLGANLGMQEAWAHSLLMNSRGKSDIFHFHFGYINGQSDTMGRLTPYITRLHKMSSRTDVSKAVAQMLQENAGRLRAEFGNDYYLVIQEIVNGRYRWNEELYQEQRVRRFNEKDDAIVSAVKEQRPDWFTI